MQTDNTYQMRQYGYFVRVVCQSVKLLQKMCSGNPMKNDLNRLPRESSSNLPNWFPNIVRAGQKSRFQ